MSEDTHAFATQDVADMLGVSVDAVRSYARDGLVSPVKGERGELLFSFQDLAVMRSAQGLVNERLPPHRVRRALRRLRERLPDGSPLSAVQLESAGGHVVEKVGERRFHAESGQGLLAFDRTTPVIAPPPSSLEASRPEVRSDPAAPTADDYYTLACELEESSSEEAEGAYVRAVGLDPTHADAHVNLGRLLHRRGDLRAAEAHFRMALAARAGDPVALFNLGVALEDAGSVPDALATYERAIAADPGNTDARHNAARLYQLSGDAQAALRHLRAMREMGR